MNIREINVLTIINWRQSISTLAEIAQNSLVTMAMYLGLLQNLWQFFNPHTCDYLSWMADEDSSSSYWHSVGYADFCCLVQQGEVFTLAISGVTRPNVTKIVHNVQKVILFSILKSQLWYCNLFQNGSADFFTLIGCHGNVPLPMAKYSTVPSSPCKALSCGEKIVKIGPVYPEIFDKIRRTKTWTRTAISISRFSAETTGPIFTKFLHNIVALVALFNPAHTRHYLIPFVNTRATKVESLPIFSQNRLPRQRPLRYRKKRSRSIIYTQKAFIRRKDCENWSSGSWDNLSPRNH